MSDPDHYYENLAFEKDHPQAGQFAIAAALMHIADKLERLGNNNADTGMGAIEGLAKEVGRIAGHLDCDEHPNANATEVSGGLALVAEELGSLNKTAIFISEQEKAPL